MIVCVVHSEVLDLEFYEWNFADPMPSPGKEFENGELVPFGNSFIVAGGYDQYDFSTSGTSIKKSLVTVNPDTRQWMTLKEEMITERYSFAAFLVPSDFVQCN